MQMERSVLLLLLLGLGLIPVRGTALFIPLGLALLSETVLFTPLGLALLREGESFIPLGLALLSEGVLLKLLKLVPLSEAVSATPLGLTLASTLPPLPPQPFLLRLREVAAAGTQATEVGLNSHTVARDTELVCVLAGRCRGSSLGGAGAVWEWGLVVGPGGEGAGEGRGPQGSGRSGALGAPAGEGALSRASEPSSCRLSRSCFFMAWTCLLSSLFSASRLSTTASHTAGDSCAAAPCTPPCADHPALPHCPAQTIAPGVPTAAGLRARGPGLVPQAPGDKAAEPSPLDAPRGRGGGDGRDTWLRPSGSAALLKRPVGEVATGLASQVSDL